MILARYLLKNLTGSALTISAVMLGALWLIQSVNFIDLAIRSAEYNTGFIFLKFLFYLLPDLLAIVCPFGFFFAVLFVYNKFIWDRELTVMRALGLNNLKLAQPVFILGGILSLVILFFQIFLIPQNVTALKDLEHQLKNTVSISIVKEGEFNSFPGITLYVREKGKDGNVLGVFVHAEEDENKPYTLIAERGILKKNSSGGVTIALFNGQRQEWQGDGKVPDTLYFEQTLVELSPISHAYDARPRKSSEFTLAELLFPDQNLFAKIDRQRLLSEGYTRLLSPFLPLVFMTVGVTLLLIGSFRRTGFIPRILGVCGIILLIQMLSLIFMNLSSKYPFLIVLAFLSIFGTFGGCIYILRKSDLTAMLSPISRKLR